MVRRYVGALFAAVVLLAGSTVMPVGAAEQNPQLEVGAAQPAREVGVTLIATAVNSVYVPLRFALTVTAAVLGGWIGLINGGDAGAAAALWDNADGDAFVTPEMIEHRRWPRLGRAR
jgi:hypothetical protein